MTDAQISQTLSSLQASCAAIDHIRTKHKPRPMYRRALKALEMRISGETYVAIGRTMGISAVRAQQLSNWAERFPLLRMVT